VKANNDKAMPLVLFRRPPDESVKSENRTLSVDLLVSGCEILENSIVISGQAKLNRVSQKFATTGCVSSQKMTFRSGRYPHGPISRRILLNKPQNPNVPILALACAGLIISLTSLLELLVPLNENIHGVFKRQLFEAEGRLSVS
jgi:hypothetical protein